jgi:pimeloyl-ACP methyl ester carboxylesterase
MAVGGSVTIARDGETAPRAEVGVRVRDVVARGARVRFVERGEGPPIVLVHDALESHAAWDGAAPVLARRMRVLAVDLPGFGDSERPPASRFAYTPSAFAEVLADVLAAVRVPRASVWGHGLGASVALALATAWADSVERLVLTGCATERRPLSALDRGLRVPVVGPMFVRQLAGLRLFRTHFAARRRPLEGPEGEARLRRWFECFDSPSGREAACATLAALADARALHASLPRVAMPMLLLGGQDDPALSPSEGRRLARDLPRGRYESFDGGSFPPAAAMPQVAEAVCAFCLGDRRATSGGHRP